MTDNATFFRKKPKKPDFEHKGEKFWISQCDRYEMWDGEYTPPLVIFIALYFDTNKEVDPKKETTLFLNKVYENGNKLFPNVSKLESFNRSSEMSLLDKTWFGGEVEKFFGSPAFKLARKDSPPTSKQAALLVNTTSLEQLVYEVIATFPDGCIQDEVLAKLPGKPYSSVTARFKGLLEKGYIEDTGLTRAGMSGKQQRVLKVKV